MDFHIKSYPSLNIDMLRQVNRQETVEAVYKARQLSDRTGLVLEKISLNPPDNIPDWDEAGMQRRVDSWKHEVEKGGYLLLAEQEGQILGFGLTGPKKQDGSIELVALFVSASVRRMGIGQVLFRELEAHAKDQGGKSLLIYANPTLSAVDFYLGQGCHLIGLAEKSLVTHLPWDVVFAKVL